MFMPNFHPLCYKSKKEKKYIKCSQSDVSFLGALPTLSCLKRKKKKTKKERNGALKGFKGLFQMQVSKAFSLADLDE